MSVFKARLVLKNQNFQLKNFSILSFKQVDSNNKQISENQEENWFKQLSSNNKPVEHGLSFRESLKAADKATKRKLILDYVSSRKLISLNENGDFNENEWEFIEYSENLSEINRSIEKISKERYYAIQRQEHKKKLIERKEIIRKEREENPNYLSNYPGYSSFMKRISPRTLARYCRNNVLSSVLNNSPSIVFDFRYKEVDYKLPAVTSLFKQYLQIISTNRELPEPLNIHFCNYENDSPLNKKFGNYLNLQDNLVNVTNKSYMDLFPREKLVYLSKDADKPMTDYDPEKIYIIGSIIDKINLKSRFLSYKQAKLDKIECLRLPLRENLKTLGSLDLAMHVVFNILANLYNQETMRTALQKAVPKRKKMMY